MSFSKLDASFYLLSFTLIFQTVFGLNPLVQTCSNSENFTANSPYEANLNKLMGYLYFKAPPTGFGLGSLGQSPDQVYGLALCRGDVSSTDCKTCVVEASSEIRKTCLYGKTAVIWYDHCLLKYNNEDFFGQIDNTNKFYMLNTQNISDASEFNHKAKKLLSTLSNEAFATPKFYAAGEMELEESKKIYGLAQCTRDLSSSLCKECLDNIIAELPSCCDGKQGGRIVTGSCNIRYESYPFVTA